MPTKNRSTLLAWTAWSIIIAVIAADQLLKVWIKTHFYINEDYELTS